MRDARPVRDLDSLLLLLALGICTLGLVEIYSATRSTALAGMHWKQLTWILLGMGCMLVMARIDYHRIVDQAPTLYAVGIALLVLVLIPGIGVVKFGARRWLGASGVYLQVSEFMKLVIIIVLARFFSEVRSERLSFPDFIKAGVLTGLPVGLILLQPDLGSSLVLIPILVVGAYLAGLQWKHAAAILMVGILLLPVGWFFVLKDYQKERIETFLRPEASPRGSGYQVLQSKIAVGSGGLRGKGIGQGSQNQLGFIPVRWSDFILAALGEELGFLGVFATLALYGFVLYRLWRIAQTAKDRAGMYIVMGVAAVIGFHVLVNVAMVIGYMPVTGIPLPLMSYGGSATLFTFIALGLVMNVRMRRFVN